MVSAVPWERGGTRGGGQATTNVSSQRAIGIAPGSYTPKPSRTEMARMIVLQAAGVAVVMAGVLKLKGQAVVIRSVQSKGGGCAEKENLHGGSGSR